MEGTPSKGPRIAIMGGVAVLAIAVIVYFSFFYPPTKNEDVAGTIGAAKKYQSEQITDKDVKLGGTTSEATASSGSIVDEETAKQYAATAQTFGSAFVQFNSRYHIGSQFVANSRAAAEALSKMAQYGMRKYENQATVGSQAQFSKDASSGVYNQAAALASQAATYMGKNAPTLGKQDAADLNARMDQLCAQASTMANSLNITLQSKFDLGSKQIGSQQMEARKKLENQKLENQKLENQQSLENRPKQ